MTEDRAETPPGVAFINGGEDAADGALDCPSCGGSGHIEDYDSRRATSGADPLLALQEVVDAWSSQFESRGHLAPEWARKARAVLDAYGSANRVEEQR